MIITDVRMRAKNGDILLVGHIEATVFDSGAKYAMVRKPGLLRIIAEEPEPKDLETFQVEVHRYIGRPGGYILVQPEHDCSWLPGWRPV